MKGAQSTLEGTSSTPSFCLVFAECCFALIRRASSHQAHSSAYLAQPPTLPQPPKSHNCTTTHLSAREKNAKYITLPKQMQMRGQWSYPHFSENWLDVKETPRSTLVSQNTAEMWGFQRNRNKSQKHGVINETRGLVDANRNSRISQRLTAQGTHNQPRTSLTTG